MRTLPEFCLRGAAAVRRLASHPLPRRQPPRGIAPAQIFWDRPNTLPGNLTLYLTKRRNLDAEISRPQGDFRVLSSARDRRSVKSPRGEIHSFGTIPIFFRTTAPGSN